MEGAPIAGAQPFLFKWASQQVRTPEHLKEHNPSCHSEMLQHSQKHNAVGHIQTSGLHPLATE